MISLSTYCPRTKFGLHREDIIKQVVNIEAELNSIPEVRPLLSMKVVKPKWSKAVYHAFTSDLKRFIRV